MRISTAIKCSNMLLLLRWQNPKSHACFLHLATEKPSYFQRPKTVPSSSSSLIIGGMKMHKSMLVYEKLDPQKRNTHVRNELIGELLRSGYLNDALKVLDEMLQPNAEFPPDKNTGQIVFAALWRLPEEEFVKLVSRFCSHGVFPDSLRPTQWITKFYKNRRIDCAWNLLHAVVELNGPVEVSSCNALFTGLGKNKQFNKMCRLMKEMKKKGILPNAETFGIRIHHLCKSRRLDRALELFEQMREGKYGVAFEPDVVKYNTLISGLCNVGRVEEGLAIMQRMISESKLSPSTATYNCLIDGLCKASQLEKSLELFHEMSKEGVPPNTIIYNTLINSLCQNKKVKAALSLFYDMKSKEVSPNTNTFNSIFKGLQEENWVEKALELMDRMVEEACNPDYRTREVLTEWLSGVGKADEMRRFLLGYKVSASTAQSGRGH